MGEAELQPQNNLLIVHATIYFYGNAANDMLSIQVAEDIAGHWNEPKGKVNVKRKSAQQLFQD